MKITAANNVKKQEIARDEYVTDVSRSCKKWKDQRVNVRKRNSNKKCISAEIVFGGELC
jgi:hypothetical protein